MLLQSTVVVALLASFSAAQTTNTTIDPSSITSTLRSQWCQGQTNVCGTLCSGEASINTCTPDTLVYNCTCEANNSAPGLQYYTGTMPTFICETVFANCIAATVGDAASQAVCTSNEKNNCGHIDPTTFVATAATTSAASTAAASSTGSAAAATGASSSSTSTAAAATLMANAKYFGTGALAVGLGAMGLLI